MTPKQRPEPRASDPESAERLADLRRALGDPRSPFLIAEEAAIYIRTTLRGFYRRLERQDVPGAKFNGRRWLYPKAGLDLFLQHQTERRRRKRGRAA